MLGIKMPVLVAAGSANSLDFSELDRDACPSIHPITSGHLYAAAVRRLGLLSSSATSASSWRLSPCGATSCSPTGLRRRRRQEAAGSPACPLRRGTSPPTSSTPSRPGYAANGSTQNEAVRRVYARTHGSSQKAEERGSDGAQQRYVNIS